MEDNFKRTLKREGKIEDYYDIDENSILGDGASSLVRKGIKKDTLQEFAIKIISKDGMGSNERENLDNELKVMSLVDHPNIVRIYEYYETEEYIFIVMELMKGGELFDRIAEADHYTEKQAAESFRPIVDAVRYCHSFHIVHRDLKAENLLYTDKEENSTLKVSDFGLAKFLIPKTGEKLFTACGSPSYIAPEILNEFGYDSKVDCWSLGVILYIMLCGFPPFYEEDNNKLFYLIKEAKFEFISPEWDNISSGAKDLISKLLVVDPNKRLTAAEILEHPWLNKLTHNEEQLPFKEDYIKYKAKVKIRNVLRANQIIKLWQEITFNQK